MHSMTDGRMHIQADSRPTKISSIGSKYLIKLKQLWPFGYTVFKGRLLQMCLQVGKGTANVITLTSKQQLTYWPFHRNKLFVMPLYSGNFEIRQYIIASKS